MKEDLVYIEHIMDCIRKIKDYSYHLDRDDFLKNELVQDAIIRNIEIIGEATKNVSAGFKQSYPDIPWKEMAGMRDKLVHDYLGVDVEVVWATIHQDIPFLEQQIQKIDVFFK
ncbi:MAG: hypothetical protein PWP52_1443 [Bacteroidales bacterium]|nr:hypothetical protein [Bacteroidales bacterium]